MDLLAQVKEGFQAVEADAAVKTQAIQFIERWLGAAEFAPYHPQLHWLIQTKKWSGLLDRFYQILPFGTGGRRGAVGVGPNRMNLWTLGASVQGHCEYLKEKFPGASALRVVVAYDVRSFEDRGCNYNPDLPNPVLHLSSRDLADYAAGVYAANGIDVHILPKTSTRFLATPELSFAIRRLHAHGGLNISASHNPPDDNGGKFYDERGGQPVSPDDQVMADLVDQVTVIRRLSWNEALQSGRIKTLDEENHEAYIDLCCRQSLVAKPKANELKIVFTPLHGVGSMTALEVLLKQGFRVLPVEEQMKPDGQFPNVTKSPNPEVPESMDRALALARAQQADLVLATDPDADRIGGMSRCSPGAPTDWMLLNGNSIAALLTNFKLEKLAEEGRMPAAPIVITTLVTTSMIARIARRFQAQIVDNLLVGFKHMAEVLWQLESTGHYEDVSGTPADFVIATEESHGALLTAHMRDKDAGAAALLLAELALDQKRLGRTVADYLGAMERRYGCFFNEVRTVTMPGVEGKQNMAKMLNRLRQTPPKEIGGLPVTAIEDLQDEAGRMGPFKGDTERAARNLLHFQLGAKARIALRPSGTEPKAKAYIEACSDPCPANTSDEAWRQTCRAVDQQGKQLGDAFMRLVLGLVENK